MNGPGERLFAIEKPWKSMNIPEHIKGKVHIL
jgi:hypothetical protein